MSIPVCLKMRSVRNPMRNACIWWKTLSQHPNEVFFSAERLCPCCQGIPIPHSWMSRQAGGGWIFTRKSSKWQYKFQPTDIMRNGWKWIVVLFLLPVHNELVKGFQATLPSSLLQPLSGAWYYSRPTLKPKVMQPKRRCSEFWVLLRNEMSKYSV